MIKNKKKFMLKLIGGGAIIIIFSVFSASYVMANAYNLTKEEALIADTLYLEAGNQSYAGKFAIAQVIAERVSDKRWPSTYTKVILQRKQFSCWNDRAPYMLPMNNMTIIVRSKSYIECIKIAKALSSGKIKGNGYNHYFNPRLCNPKWFKSAIKWVDIDDHRFCVL